MRNRKIAMICALVIITTASANAQYQKGSFAETDHYAVCRDSVLDEFITGTMNTYHIPGLAASIVKEGQIIWTGAYGLSKIEQDINFADSTICMISSLSKIIAGVALMGLYDDGMFNLDDDIDSLLPFNVNNPDYPDSPITFRMLLTHTSSIDNNTSILGPLVYHQGDSPISLEYFAENYFVPGGEYYSDDNYGNLPPGGNWDYCDVAIALCGYLVESISGMSYPEFCNQYIFGPLEMNETSWFLADLDTNNVAIRYIYSNGSYIPRDRIGTPYYPAWQLRTSVTQLMRFLNAFMQYGNYGEISILDSSTVELMTTVHYDAPNFGQGLIWRHVFDNNHWFWGHGGSVTGAYTHMSFCPAENCGIIILTNGSSLAGMNLIVDELYQFAFDYPTAIAEEDTSLPSLYNLSQNYPNPFNASTIIKYDLPRQSRVTIDIYDILGRKVGTIQDGLQPAGNHQTIWDASDFSSGVYFYKLQAGDYIQIRKTMLLK